MPLKPNEQSTFDKWLQSQEANFSKEDYEQLRALYQKSEPAQQFTATAVMMRDDYGKNGRELQQRLSAIEADAQKLLTYENELKEWEAHLASNTVSREQYDAIQREREQLARNYQAVEARLKGMGIEDLLEAENSNESPQPEQRAMPTNNNHSNNGNNQPSQSPIAYATDAVVNQRIQEAAISTAMIDATMSDLREEYTLLTGKPLPADRRSLLAEALTAGKPLEDYIQEKFDFNKLRTDKQAADMNAEVERRVQQQVAQRLSERQLPTGGGFAQSPVLAQTLQAVQQAAAGNDPKAGLPLFAKPGQPGRAAARATEAFLTGKYNGHGFNPMVNRD